MNWVPTMYDGYETAWSEEDECFLARCAPEYGLLAYVKMHGDTREEAIGRLVEVMPDVACMNHKTLDEWVQRARVAEKEVERLRTVERSMLGPQGMVNQLIQQVREWKTPAVPRGFSKLP